MYEFEELVDLGVYNFAGYDDDGEKLYTLDVDRAKEVAPEVYWEHTNEIDAAILKAISLGLLELDIDSDTMDVTYKVTDHGNDVLGPGSGESF